MRSKSRSRSRSNRRRGGRVVSRLRRGFAVLRSLWSGLAAVCGLLAGMVVAIVRLPRTVADAWEDLGRRRRRRARQRRARARRWGPLSRLRYALPVGWHRSVPWRRTIAGIAVGGTLVYGCATIDRQSFPGPDLLAGERPTLHVLPVMPVRFDGRPLEWRLRDIPRSQRDEFLASPVLRDPEFARAVHWWVDYWRGPARKWFPGFLTRMAWLGPSVDSAVAARGFPPSLRYLPLIESGYDPAVTSTASAVGLWQLMSPTARGLGLEVSPLVDERRDPEKSTEAALAYLDDLHDEFESWFLVLAAYNSGPTRIRSILRRHAPNAARTDLLYWSLRDHFPRETREFLPKLYGAMWVASRPDVYGFESPVEEPFEFDTVRVHDQTTLDVVAIAAAAPHEEIIRLNPAFLRGITPADRTVSLRVPKGGGYAFAINLSRIPRDARVTFVEHVVSSGETLSQIAGRYGVPTAEIEAANPSLRPHALPVGARLTVPVAPSGLR